MSTKKLGNHLTFKVVLLGEGRVGKTSLVVRYTSNEFSANQTATIQASFVAKNVLVGGESVTLAIWDTAGQERFHALGPIYYRDADAALLVYDLTDRDSFERVKSWVKELKAMAGKEIVLTIAANKADLEQSRQVDLGSAIEYAASIGGTHFLTSAKSNTGVDETFASIASRVLARRRSEPVQESPAVPAHQRKRSVVIVDSAPQAAPESRCCA